MAESRTEKHVIIVGGGFAGTACARGLGGQAGVRVTLLDINNYHQFQPLLYQVATSQLSPDDVSYSLRKIFVDFPNVSIKQGEVVAVDPREKSVTTRSGESYAGDFVVLAAGSRANFFDTPGAKEFAFPLYSLEDAEQLRSRILRVFEDADRNPDLINEGALNFVIVGAGPTGVEMAGALSDLLHRTMKIEYPDLPVAKAKIFLIDHGRAVLAAFSEKSHHYAREKLIEAGVDVRLGIAVKEVTSGHVKLSDGTQIKTRAVVWAGGLKAAPLAAGAGIPLGHGDRIDVAPDLTVASFPGLYALGDFANTPNDVGGILPQLGAVAMQSGSWAAKNILAEIAGEARTPFEYHDKGIMAMIGRGAAVAEIGTHRHELSGPLAVAAWLGVHATLMTSARNRIEALVDWTWNYFSKVGGPQVLDQSNSTEIQWDQDVAASGSPSGSASTKTSAPAAAKTGGGAKTEASPRASSPASSTVQPIPFAMPSADDIPRDYDLIIIGSGAGGGTLAHHLAPSGKRILILERGGFLPREKENWDVTDVFIQNRYQSVDPWYDANGATFQPGVHYFVGGATKMYGAALFRLREKDFQEVRHHDGVSPAWPIAYADLEPYYTQAERLFVVHGLRGADPTEPPASAPYPYPPVKHEARIQALSDSLARAGFHPFPAPCGVMLDEQHRDASKCIKCDTCDGYPCLVHAKADAEVACVRPALEYPNVTLLTEAKVVRLNTSPSGRKVSEVVVERDGKTIAFRGGIVVLSAGASNSAKILLQSANDQHPKGLANGSDQVGRNFMFHNSQAVVALSVEPNLTKFQKTLSVNDFYFGADDFPYPIGNIQMIGKSKGPMFRGDAPRFAPGWTLDKMALHALDFWLTTEDLPRPENRVTLAADGKIKLSYTPNNQEPTRLMLAKLKGMLHDMECHPHLIPNELYFSKTIPLAGVGHQAGTCRFGIDPKTSVLDVNCKAHELDNLYVVDTSFFVSIGAVNPSLTAIANALRIGDHLLERWG